MAILEITDLKKSYNGRAVLDGLELIIEKNEIITIEGRSGSGKTTLLLCVLGFTPPEAGSIVLAGQEIKDWPIEQRQLAYVPQDYGLFPHLSVEKNIAFGLALRSGKANQKVQVSELLEKVGLPKDLGNRSIEGLSGGEKQRIAVARALAIKPKLFLLDEPLSAVDPETRLTVAKEIKTLLKQFGIPAVIINHEPAISQYLGDKLYKLVDGRLVSL